jgi:hypothetical protein
MNIIEVTYEQAKMDIEEFFNSNIERSPMSVAFFYTWGRLDSPEAVVEEWRESLNNGVSESLDAILLRHDIVLHD